MLGVAAGREHLGEPALQLVEGGFPLRGASEAVGVRARNLVFGHPGSVCAVAVPGDRCELGLGTAQVLVERDRVRGQLARRYVDD